MIDLKIQCLDFTESPSITSAVESHLESLKKTNSQIMSCHVVISKPHRKQHHGNTYQVKLRLHMAGKQIIIDKDSGKNHAHEDIYIAIRDAFLAAKRKVEEFSRMREGRIKERVRPMHAKIVRIIPADDCGFIVSEDHREIYFHKNALLNDNFENLKVGQEVRFSEAMGEKGPQITSMEIVGHSGHVIPV